MTDPLAPVVAEGRRLLEAWRSARRWEWREGRRLYDASRDRSAPEWRDWARWLHTHAPALLDAVEQQDRMAEALEEAIVLLHRQGHHPETEPGGFPGCDECEVISRGSAALAPPAPSDRPEDSANLESNGPNPSLRAEPCESSAPSDPVEPGGEK